MRNWKAEVQSRLANLDISPTPQANIVEEVGEHLEDRHGTLIARGMSPKEADRAVLQEARRVEDPRGSPVRPLFVEAATEPTAARLPDLSSTPTWAAASYLPARRATRVDPVSALRAD